MQTALKDTPAARRSTLPSGFVAPQPDELSGMFSELEIVRLVGQGGMGAVYEARQRSLQRSVAVKLFPHESAADPTFAERFQLEAQALARLSHPNIVTVHDFDRAGDFCYFVMEYVEGGDLRRLERAGPLPPRMALRIAAQIADALCYAHGRGVVHRDIKPENVLLEAVDDPEVAWNVKLADFGLAKLLALDPAGFMLTDPEHTMGTPHYMAPEQIECPAETDHRADVYSLGVVLYEMLTGELPLGRFGLVSEKAGVDARFDEVVLRCLAKEPDRRYQQVGQLQDHLAALTRSADRLPAARPQPERASRRRRPLVRLATALALAAAVSWLGWQIIIRIRGGDGEAPQIEIEASADVDLDTAGAREPTSSGTEADDAPQEGGETPAGDRSDTEQAAAGLPEVELSNPKVMTEVLHRLLRVDYRFRRGGPSAGRRYFLVIESSDRVIDEDRLYSIDLAAEGTLRRGFRPRPYDVGPYEVYIEVQNPRPGTGRRRISNVVEIESPSP
jgi:serine/threonine protein kinase